MAIQFLNTVAVDTDVLYVDTSSNRVGIGEPNPDYELHVDGQIYSESSTFPVYFLQRETSITGDGTFTTTGGIASGFHLRTNSSGTIQNGFGGGIVFSLTDSGTASNTAARIYARRDGGNTTGALQFWGGFNGNSPLMTMRASGNVGIGTSSPSSLLEVFDSNGVSLRFGDVASTPSSQTAGYIGMSTSAYSGNNGDLVLIPRTSSASNILLMEGKVGIGTSSPDTILEVVDENPILTIRDTSTGLSSANSALRIAESGSGDTLGNYWDLKMKPESSGGTTNFAIANSILGDVFNINYQANVGIGTANPINGKLQIDSTGNQISIETGTSGDGRLQIGHFSNGTFIGTYGDDGGAADIIRFGTHSGDERMRIDSSGRVGIGTSSPSSYLEIETSGSSGSDDIAIFSRSTGEVLKISREASEAVLNASSNLTLSADYDNNTTSTGSNVIFKTDATERMRINSSGNVGIGTSSPSGGKLHIYATNTPVKFESSGLTLYNTYTNSNGNFGFVGSGNGVASGGNANDFGIQSVNNFVFATGGSTERMRIDSSGNVGIGGTPTHKLYVRNDVVATSDLDPTAIKLYNNNDGGAAIEFSNGVGGNSKLSFGVESTGAGTNDTYIGFSTGVNGGLSERMRIDSGGNLSLNSGKILNILNSVNSAGGSLVCPGGGSLALRAYGNEMIVLNEDSFIQFKVGSGSEKMRLDGNGNLLINRTGTSGLGKLNVDGGADFTGGNVLLCRDTGAVGIGTSSPDALLDIGVNNIITLDDTGSSTGFIGMGSYNDGTKNRAQGTSYYGFGLEIDRPNQNISFNSYDSNGALTAGTNILVLKRTGNVGIGTTSPAGKLEINGGTGVATSGGTLIVRQDGDTLADGIALTSSNAISHRMFKNSVGTFFMGPSSNAEAFALDLNGNVGIGTSSPVGKLAIKGGNVYIDRDTTSGNYAFGFYRSGAERGRLGFDYSSSTLNLQADGVMTFLTSGENERMRIDANGNVGIGTTSPSAKLDVNGQGNFSDYLNVDSSAGIKSTGWVHLHRYGFNKNVAVGNNGTDVDLYVPNGSVGIGTSNPSARLSVENTTSTGSSGIVRLKSLTVSNGPFIRVVDFVRSNNSTRGYIAMNPYSVQYNSTSDYRLKRNVTPMENSIDRIKLLKPSRFNWVEGPDDYVVDGFIAHEVQDVVHDAVSGEKDAVDKNNEPAYQGIDQSKLVPLLTAALQDAITKIENLETRIQILENN